MHPMNRKAMAEVVQIAMITMMSILAIVSVVRYVSSINTGLNQLSPAVDCITQKSDVVSACYTEENTVHLLVNRFSGEEINLKITLGNEEYRCGTDPSLCTTCTIPEGTNKIYVPSSSLTQTLSTITVQLNACTPQEVLLRACASPNQPQ